MQDYHRLRVWRHAHELAVSVRDATNRFPRTGYADFKSQLTSAAESVAFNIVEGCGTTSQKDFARFLGISVKSTTELQYQISLARDYGVLEASESQTLTKEIVEIRKMLCGLRSKVLRTPSPGRPPTDKRATEKRETDSA